MNAKKREELMGRSGPTQETTVVAEWVGHEPPRLGDASAGKKLSEDSVSYSD